MLVNLKVQVWLLYHRYFLFVGHHLCVQDQKYFGLCFWQPWQFVLSIQLGKEDINIQDF